MAVYRHHIELWRTAASSKAAGAESVDEQESDSKPDAKVG